jgi:hypothetical protein
LKVFLFSWRWSKKPKPLVVPPALPPIPVRYKGYDCLQFNITVTMPKRWIPHFLAMLKYMQYLGSVGSSRKVSLYADGNGDFRPCFDFHPSLASDAKPIADPGGNREYDAG